MADPETEHIKDLESCTLVCGSEVMLRTGTSTVWESVLDAIRVQAKISSSVLILIRFVKSEILGPHPLFFYNSEADKTKNLKFTLFQAVYVSFVFPNRVMLESYSVHYHTVL